MRRASPSTMAVRIFLNVVESSCCPLVNCIGLIVCAGVVMELVYDDEGAGHPSEIPVAICKIAH